MFAYIHDTLIMHILETCPPSFLSSEFAPNYDEIFTGQVPGPGPEMGSNERESRQAAGYRQTGQ